MKKPIIYTLALAIAAQAPAMSRADDALYGYDRMILHFTDGTCEDIPLNEDVVAIPKGDVLKFKINGAVYTYNRDDVQKITYGAALSGVESVVGDQGTGTRINDNNVLVFNGLNTATTAWIYSVDGRCVGQVEVSPTANRVDVSFLPAGVYIVRRNQETTKIIVR